MVGILLAIILPTSLIMSSLAVANTTSSRSNVPEATTLKQMATSQQTDPSANAPILPTTPANPQSPLPSPLPLDTASPPLTPAQLAPDKPGSTDIESKAADSQHQMRESYTTTFKSDGKTIFSQQTLTTRINSRLMRESLGHEDDGILVRDEYAALRSGHINNPNEQAFV